jgi:hypothetical protein
MLAQSSLLRFPSRTGKLILPERPMRATLAGLGLYETRWWHQRLLVLVGNIFLRLHLGRTLQTRKWPTEVNAEWWRHWIADIVQPIVGRVNCFAIALLEARQAVLLMDEHGHSMGFAKIWHCSTIPEAQTSEALILDALQKDPPTSFRVPRMLAHGVFEDHLYQLFSALPDGPKRQPPHDPALIAAVVDELQAKLDSLPGMDHAAHHVMGHGDFSHRNLRLAADGQLWLFDWEYAGWSPRLADETRYWTTWFGAGLWPRVGRDSTRILAMLRQRGTDAEILEAVCWPEHNLPIEQALRDAIQARIAAA